MDFIFYAGFLVMAILALGFLILKIKETNQESHKAINHAREKREVFESRLNELIEIQKQQMDLQEQLLKEVKEIKKD